MLHTLGLAGDLDDVDLVQDVERAFGLRLPDEELTRCSTVGDLFELVVRKLPDGFAAADRCATAMCFYRVRRVILNLAPNLTVRPSTPIQALRSISVKSLYHAIQREAGLTPPSVYLSGWGGLALILFFALPIGLLVAGQPWWSAVLAAALSLALYRVSPVRLPPAVATIGDLIQVITAHNVAALAAEGARLRPDEAWRAFRTICGSHAVAEGGEIEPGTLIYAA